MSGLSEDEKRMREVDRAMSLRGHNIGPVTEWVDDGSDDGLPLYAPPTISADTRAHIEYRLARCLAVLHPDVPVERIVEVVEASGR